MGDAGSKRIGDAERDQAVRLLQEHVAAGRIDNAEFDERMTKAITAKTMADLDPLFADLPGDRPHHLVVSAEDQARQARAAELAQRRERSARTKRIGQVVLAALWPAAIVSVIVFGSWFVLMIPIFFSGVIALAFGLHRDDEPSPEELDQHRPRGKRQLGTEDNG